MKSDCQKSENVNSFINMNVGKFVHNNCRNAIYPQSNFLRFPVPDELVLWTTKYDKYQPLDYESSSIEGKPWADPKLSDENFKPVWNSLDGKVDRRSFTGNYDLDSERRPLNPYGRTGIVGRGLLGRWGPNHAADPIVTKWKRTTDKLIAQRDGKRILQMLAIQRKDNGQNAIPGGMVDADERISATLKREFLEEALDNASADDILKVDKFFEANPITVFQGYVDDPRNTDNAWMETTACNFHDETGETLETMNFRAGDDASHVHWLDICNELALYASHRSLVKQVVDRLNAFW